ncbi:hypothetical protein NQZ68_025115 [Dissostichus eleginoides]|nr:hypothetical protein NQZ68_025115 [Dissostichus eleginoides]
MGSILVGQTSELIPNVRPLCHARLLLTGKSQALAVFIDSGSDVSIIDEELAQQLGIQQADALSRQFGRGGDTCGIPDTILPAPRVIGVLAWEIED